MQGSKNGRSKPASGDARLKKRGSPDYYQNRPTSGTLPPLNSVALPCASGRLPWVWMLMQSAPRAIGAKPKCGDWCRAFAPPFVSSGAASRT
jgi:hypothetical protein